MLFGLWKIPYFTPFVISFKRRPRVEIVKSFLATSLAQWLLLRHPSSQLERNIVWWCVLSQAKVKASQLNQIRPELISKEARDQRTSTWIPAFESGSLLLDELQSKKEDLWTLKGASHFLQSSGANVFAEQISELHQKVEVSKSRVLKRDSAYDSAKLHFSFDVTTTYAIGSKYRHLVLLCLWITITQ